MLTDPIMSPLAFAIQGTPEDKKSEISSVPYTLQQHGCSEAFRSTPAFRNSNPAPKFHSEGITYLRTKTEVTDFYSLLKSFLTKNL